MDWYAGKQWDFDIGDAKKTLADLEKHYPGATGYEVAGPYAVYEGYDEDVGLKAQLAARMAVAKARLSSAFDKYGEGVGGARERAADLAHAAQARADAYGRAARRKIDEVTENEPLAIGAAGLVLGAAIALALAAATGKKD